MPSNMKVVSLEKLGNFYWEILECLGEIWRNAAKVPEDVQRHHGLSGV
jgi:hypothetical protein